MAYGQSAGAVAPGQSVSDQSQGGTPVSELVVNAQKKAAPQSVGPLTPPMQDPGPLSAPLSYNPPAPAPQADQTPQGTSLNYNNSDAVKAVQNADMANQPIPGGTSSPGLYGLLPPSMQHGTLRSLLGNLGDAISGGGSTAKYAQMMERQQIGDAMAGIDYDNPASVEAAMQRVAATGAPQSIETADNLQKNFNDVQLRKAQMEANASYRDALIADRQQRTQDQQAQTAQRYMPQLGGLLKNVKTPVDYGRVYDAYGPLAKQLGGPNATPASVWGLPEKEAWQPGMTDNWGITGYQQDESQNRQAAIAQSNTNNVRSTGVSRANALTSAGARVQAARIGAGSRPESEAQFDTQLVNDEDQSQRTGIPLSAGEQAAYNKRFSMSRGTRPLIVGANGVSTAAPTAQSLGGAIGAAAGNRLQSQIVSGPGGKGITPQQAARLPRGTPFRTTDGRVLVRQ